MELEPRVQELIAKLHANDTKAVIYVTGGGVQVRTSPNRSSLTASNTHGTSTIPLDINTNDFLTLRVPHV